MEWNFGDMIDVAGEHVDPASPAIIQGDRVIPWRDFTPRTNRLARALLSSGAEAGDKVGFYMRNQPEYVETLTACHKARLTHVNVNYRYRDEELRYIFDNSDSKIVVYDREFAEMVARIRPGLPKVALWVEAGANSNPLDGSVCYDGLVEAGDGTRLDIKRSGDDLLFLYTGGTTGMPKGVMWPQNTLQQVWNAAAEIRGLPVLSSLDDLKTIVREAGSLMRTLPACPLMHGTGLFTTLPAINNGGCAVLLPTRTRFNPEELWQQVQAHTVTSMAIVGDAFAKPMLAVLDANPGKYNTSSLTSITSSGTMWSMEVKQGLIKHIPQVQLIDAFGASEAVGFGTSVTTAEGVSQTSKFTIGATCKVFTEDGREVTPGSGEAGIIACGGNIPLGYYKDPEKTAKTYKTINGERYALPGDWCTVAEDGTITLLGRGSHCINTGGEKVFPEEVEEQLKTHPDVTDALVFGLPDDKWGQAITAVVALQPGTALDEASIRDHVRQDLAAYKVPKKVLAKADLRRAANGKADYGYVKEFAMRELGISA